MFNDENVTVYLEKMERNSSRSHRWQIIMMYAE